MWSAVQDRDGTRNAGDRSEKPGRPGSVLRTEQMREGKVGPRKGGTEQGKKRTRVKTSEMAQHPDRSGQRGGATAATLGVRVTDRSSQGHALLVSDPEQHRQRETPYTVPCGQQVRPWWAHRQRPMLCAVDCPIVASPFTPDLLDLEAEGGHFHCLRAE